MTTDETPSLCMTIDGESVTIAVGQAIIAGWTGRDRAAMEHHVEELAALGVPRPSAMPLFYRVAARRLTSAPVIEACGPESGGEAEPVLVRHAGRLYVAIGSDHTDRALEAHSVALSKQICDKPIGPELWPFDLLADHWDSLVLRSWVTEDGTRRLYQEGALSAQLPPADLIAGYLGGPGDLPDGTVMFCGTMPAIGGVRPTPALTVALEDPVRGLTLEHSYATRVLPIVA